MRHIVYAILEPGGDRPYISHGYPHEYQAKPGSKIYQVELDFPDFEKIDGVIQPKAVELVEVTERKMAEDLIEEREFTCPTCGSHMFGSSMQPDGTYDRMCHGYIGPGNPCHFTFPQSDDNKYFKGTGSFSQREQVACTTT